MTSKIGLIAILAIALMLGVYGTGESAGGGSSAGSQALGDVVPGSRYQLPIVFGDFDELKAGKKLDFIFDDGGGAGDNVTSIYASFLYDQSRMTIDSVVYLGAGYPTFTGLDYCSLKVSPNGWARVTLAGFDARDFDSIKTFSIWATLNCPSASYGTDEITITDGQSHPDGAVSEWVSNGVIKYPAARTHGGMHNYGAIGWVFFWPESTYLGGQVVAQWRIVDTYPPSDTIHAVAQWDSTYLHLDSVSTVGAVLAGQDYTLNLTSGTAILSVDDNTIPQNGSGLDLCYFYFTVSCDADLNSSYLARTTSYRVYACPGYGYYSDYPDMTQIRVPDYQATFSIRDVTVPKNTQNFNVFVDLKNNFPVYTNNTTQTPNASFRFRPDSVYTTLVGLSPDNYFVQDGDTLFIQWTLEDLGDGSRRVYEKLSYVSEEIPASPATFFPVAALRFNAGGTNGTDSVRLPVATSGGLYHVDHYLVPTCDAATLYATNPQKIYLDPGAVRVYTAPPPPPPCPYLYAWDGERFAEENTILHPENNVSLAKRVPDYCRLTTALTPTAGDFLLQIREFESEESYIDDFELQVVDHREGTLLAVGLQGALAVFKGELLPSSAIDQDGIDHSKEVIEEDGVFYKPQTSGELIATYFVGKNFDWSAAALTNGGPGPKPRDINKLAGGGDNAGTGFVPAGILTIEILSLSGEWITIENPYERFKSYTDLPTFSPQQFVINGGITVRYRWEDAAYFDKLSIYLPCEQEIVSSSLPLVSCQHSVNGDVTGAARYLDDDMVVLTPNQTIEVRFAASDLEPVADGFVRDYVFKSSGFYLTFRHTPPMPIAFELHANYPNPFNPTTTISYTLPKSAEVTLMVYNVLGQQVKELVHEYKGPGTHNVTWDGTDATGSQVASGIYLYKIVAADYTSTRKMLLIK